MQVEQLLQESDSALDITATSAPVDLRQPIEGRGHRDRNWGISPIHIYAAAGLTGSIQGVLAADATLAADIDDATGLWEDIDGLFFEGVLVSDLVEEGYEDVEAGDEGCGVFAEPLDNKGAFLRDNPNNLEENGQDQDR